MGSFMLETTYPKAKGASTNFLHNVMISAMSLEPIRKRVGKANENIVLTDEWFF